MRMKSLVLIFIALGCGLVASIGISQLLERGANAKGVVETEEILVALKDIDINATLNAENVKIEAWPKAKLQEGAIRTFEEVKDKFAKSRIIKGDAITLAKITDQVGNVVHLIPAGFRVIPVPVEEATVMKGISPGDRVDINLSVKRSEVIREDGVFTIMQAVRIFAVGSNTEKVIDPKGGEASFRTVSVLVTPEQARHLIGAMDIGKVKLTLRHPNEPIDTKSDPVTPLPDILKANSFDSQEQIQPQQTASNAVPAAGEPSLLSTFGTAFERLAKTAQNIKPEQVAADSGHKMHIYTNSDVKEYLWQDRNGMPQESTVFSAGVSGPSSAPAPAPAAGAGATNRPGYLLERRPVWMTETPR
jgi:pilus assembly protein CpaB